MSATVRDVSLRYYVGNHNTSGHGSEGRDIVIVSFLFTAKKNVEKSYFFVIELNIALKHFLLFAGRTKMRWNL